MEEEIFMTDNKIIRGVWFGSKLTAMQQLCIKSYIDNGHEFHLYISEPTTDIPEGVIVKDANKILPQSARDKFTCHSHFSDYFRVLLILREGGWYVDMDTVCLRPFDFPEPFAFVSEDTSTFSQNKKDPKIPPKPVSEVVSNYISGCIFKSPADSPFLKYIVNVIETMDTLHPKDWICVGPALFSEAIPKFDLLQYVKPPIVFDGVNPDELMHLVSSNVPWNISEKSYAIHFRTSWWEGRLSKSYPSDSLFEQLKRKHGVA
jgi:mannosyltransferase OCH1-like enzyme